jgi:hypothetical protein
MNSMTCPVRIRILHKRLATVVVAEISDPRPQTNCRPLFATSTQRFHSSLGEGLSR